MLKKWDVIKIIKTGIRLVETCWVIDYLKKTNYRIDYKTQKQVFYSVHVGGYTISEAAREYNITYNTAYYIVTKCYKLIKSLKRGEL